MDKDIAEPDPSRQRNGVVEGLYGEFTDSLNAKVRYSVSLTESALTIQKISSSPGQDKVVFNLTDCLGCRAYKVEDEADVGAFVTAYFYPFKRRWMSTGMARQKVEQCFRVALVEDPLTNLQEAERWARAIREASIRQIPRRHGVVYSEVRRPCRVMVLVNPQSGRGQALQLFSGHIEPMLTEASVPYTLVITEHQNHARDLVRETDLSQWDALVILSGDGLLFEVLNGLLEREDWEEAIQTPLGILPGGSGNALAASVHHYTESPPALGEELLLSCGFLLCKGLVSRLDLVSVHLASSQRIFSFLSLAWGFVADIDIESEKYRLVGAMRFLVGTLVRLASLRVYQGRLAYLPVKEALQPGQGTKAHAPPSTPQHSSLCSSLPCGPNNSPNQNSRHNHSTNSNHNTAHNSSNNAITTMKTEPQPANQKGPPDSLLADLGQPVPEHWTVVNEEDFVLVLAMFQSHLAEDMFAAPGAAADDGFIHLLYVRAGISRLALLRLFMAMEKGAHLAIDCPHLVYERVKAFRLEPLTPEGAITVDGEMVEYGPVQAQVHEGIARLISG
ncbi:sphingosine kinase 1-like [Coregonus clupeaformis]|uniref:sphingosine kinase 1-like n=1 Tax=Coregonus clupeaformis TaxID=59861 RepID=UPI001BE0028A|nr:sphingosine kinase 1-like [Coregonus clupeaformis]